MVLHIDLNFDYFQVQTFLTPQTQIVSAFVLLIIQGIIIILKDFHLLDV